ncbi:MAG: hypothetical protein Q8O40_14835 [Chloroflexota bacterium]|nr:hypothetical protein [Chloroflexota bacterium]
MVGYGAVPPRSYTQWEVFKQAVTSEEEALADEVPEAFRIVIDGGSATRAPVDSPYYAKEAQQCPSRMKRWSTPTRTTSRRRRGRRSTPALPHQVERKSTPPPPHQPERPERSVPKRQPERGPPAPPGSWGEEDDGSEKLKTLLDVMGVPADVTARIVGGYRVIGHIRNHPANLHQFLMTHFFKRPALEQQVPVIVQEMMPYLGRPDVEGPPTSRRTREIRISAGPPYGGVYRRGWDTPYPPQWEYERPPRSPDREERESPAIKELRAMVTSLTETVQAEREERRLKEEEEEERRREQEAVEARYAAVSDQVGALAARLEELMAAKTSEQHEQAQSGLAQEVVALRKSLADTQAKEIRDENASLRAQIGELKDTLGTIYLKVEQAGAAPAGRTAEDLIAELGPVVLEKIDSIGTNVKEELGGWRDKMTPGGVSLQSPGLRPPADKGANPAAGAPSPVDEAKEIARLVATPGTSGPYSATPR